MSQPYPNQSGPGVPPQQPAAPYSPQPVNPGQTLGVVGLVLDFIVLPVGLILSIVALSKSKKAGMTNGVAVAGIVVGAIFMVFAIIGIAFAVVGATALAQQCQELGPGVHYVNGVTVTCS